MASRGSKDVADQHPHRSEDTSESAGKGCEDTRTAQRSRDLVLTRFWKLPLELRERILVEACGPSALHRWTIAGRSTDCTTTMLRLLRASKVFHPVVLPLLYRNVRVTRPSALDMFERTLAERPEFGKMVERLHIGPDEELPLNWWPIRGVGSGDSRRTLFRLNLRSEGKHWRGCKSYEVDMQTFDDEDPDKAGALEEAFEVAAEAFDIGLPTRPDYMEHDKWTAGVLQVQAIMELYYLEMLRCENRMKRAKGAEPARKRTRSENNPSGRDAQPAYPRLYLEDDELRNMAPRAEVDASRPVFKVTCTRFWKRMYSAGAPTDRFDHRLLFAACQSPWLAEGPDHVTHSGDNYPPHEVTALDEYQLERASKVSTVTGVLWCAQRVLNLTSQVRSFSLTGLLQASSHPKRSQIPSHPNFPASGNMGSLSAPTYRPCRSYGPFLSARGPLLGQSRYCSRPRSTERSTTSHLQSPLRRGAG